MSDSITRLNAALEGRYAIERELGEGGMATVYLADDLKHERKVALKVLKPELAAVVGAERFLAEIKTTANLQHPHILPLFDSGEADGFLFYVMPYVEGESLREKLDRERQLPVDEAVGIACDVAEALQSAHEQGVIHRDVKPANILLTKGRPVVADFGIALAVTTAGGGRLTETGLSMGTPHYMSPEQAAGDQDVDARTDGYSLGCVLFEMLAGQPPHVGTTAQAILAKVLTSDPQPVSDHRPSVPLNVSEAICKATERLPADRFATAVAFRGALADSSFRWRMPGGPVSVQRLRLTATVAVVGWALVLGALSVWLLQPRSATGPVSAESSLHMAIILPDSAPLAVVAWGRQLALSPDGSTLAYVAQEAMTTRLYRRALDEAVVTPILGTEGANEVFFSPDGEWIGFRSGLDLVQKVPVGGGPVEAVGSGLTAPGAAWIPGAIAAGSRDNTELILFPDDGGDVRTIEVGLFASASLPDPAWVLGSLPDQRAGVVELETGRQFVLTDAGPRPFVHGDESGGLRGTSFQYVPTGHLIFVRLDGVVASAPFEAESLTITGDAELLLQGVRVSSYTNSAQLAVGPDGSVIFAQGAFAPVGRPAFMDESGLLEELPFATRFYGALALSPNGRRIAAHVYPAVGPQELWILDLDSDRETRLKSGWTYNGFAWWPDGESIVYFEFERVAGEAGEGRGRLIRHYMRDMVTTDTLPFTAGLDHISEDGRWLVGSRWGFTDPPPGIWLYDLEADSAIRVHDEPTAGVSRLSPGADWLAWSHVQGDQYQIFVAPFADGRVGDEALVGAGFSPAWAHDGGRLYWYEYPDPIRFMYAEPPDFSPQVLTTVPRFISRAGRDIDVAPDGRILYVATAEQAPISHLTMITNWTSELPVAGN